MEDSQEKDYSFLGNDTFPNLYDALVYERKFKSEYLERQIYERSLKSEPSIVKLVENIRDLSKLSTSQAAQTHYMNADVTPACERCCVTNGYLQRLVWDRSVFLKTS